MTAILILASSFSYAKKPAKTEPGYSVDPTFIKLSESDKGTLFLDPKNCKTVMVRDNLEISLAKTTLPNGAEGENFHIKFPDGDTAIGNIYKSGAALPACFHSLTTASTDFRVKIISYAKNAMENCKDRPKDGLFEVTQELRYISDKKFKQEFKKNAGDAFMHAHSIKIQAGTGLSFYSGFDKQDGNIITTSDLKPKTESYLDKCESPTKPGPKAPPEAKPPARTT